MSLLCGTFLDSPGQKSASPILAAKNLSTIITVFLVTGYYLTKYLFPPLVMELSEDQH